MSAVITHHADPPETVVRVLVGRLNTGWILCDRESDSKRQEHLEDHWIALLHQYEAICDQAIVTSATGAAA